MRKLIKLVSYLIFTLPEPISEFIGQHAVDYLLRFQFLQLNARFSIKDEDLADWKQRTRFFFMLGMGRSGTQFLSTLLDKATGTLVVHEPIMTDFAAYIRGYHSEREAYKFVRVFRQREIYARAKNRRISTYGEVNSLLRRHIEPLREAFPEASFIHLVRDGRDVVRSMMSRRLFHPTHPVTRLIEPSKRDPRTQDWHRMDRFERLCWFWKTENQYVRERADRTVQFEKLIADYAYFKECILQPLQLSLSASQWRQAVARPKNETNEYAISHWSQWDTARHDAFMRICLDEMTLNGYECNWDRTDAFSESEQD